MDEGKKKAVMIGVIVVCLVVAAAVTFSTRRGGGGGLDSIGSEEKVWVKCANKECGAEYETGKKEYYQHVRDNTNPMMNMAAPMVCKDCGEESVFLAVKCGKCGHVFFKGAAGPGDFSDRCPKCKYSAQEEGRKAAANKG